MQPLPNIRGSYVKDIINSFNQFDSLQKNNNNDDDNN